jgi:2-polyprenyl-6-methoxyphenol hydroxylase-like FAD-dependent oxidoreductase
VLRDVDLTEPNKIWQHPWQLVHRVHLHEELKRRATSPEGEGLPVVLKTCSRVIDADASAAVAILENGERVQGDVLIGADGVHVSPTHPFCMFSKCLHPAVENPLQDPGWGH